MANNVWCVNYEYWTTRIFPFCKIFSYPAFMLCSIQKRWRYEQSLSFPACSCRFHSQVLYSTLVSLLCFKLKLLWMIAFITLPPICKSIWSWFWAFVSQCRFDIGILVTVSWVSSASFLLPVSAISFIFLPHFFPNLQCSKCRSFMSWTSFSCSFYACHATLQSHWWYLAPNGTTEHSTFSIK